MWKKTDFVQEVIEWPPSRNEPWTNWTTYPRNLRASQVISQVQKPFWFLCNLLIFCVFFFFSTDVHIYVIFSPLQRKCLKTFPTEAISSLIWSQELHWFFVSKLFNHLMMTLSPIIFANFKNQNVSSLSSQFFSVAISCCLSKFWSKQEQKNQSNIKNSSLTKILIDRRNKTNPKNKRDLATWVKNLHILSEPPAEEWWSNFAAWEPRILCVLASTHFWTRFVLFHFSRRSLYLQHWVSSQK